MNPSFLHYCDNYLGRTLPPKGGTPQPQLPKRVSSNGPLCALPLAFPPGRSPQSGSWHTAHSGEVAPHHLIVGGCRGRPKFWCQFIEAPPTPKSALSPHAALPTPRI